MKRRDFLKSAGCFVVSATATGLVGCGDDDAGRDASVPLPDSGREGDAGDAGDASGPLEALGTYAFPQGVASGDPRATSVMLWTRAKRTDNEDGAIALRLQVARDDGFRDLVFERELSVSSASDFTARVLVEDLDSDTIYYYRFVAGMDESTAGRTWTAPAADADVPVSFVWASCQDYSAGFYGAYRRMMLDDEERAEEDRIRFVLHVGDFIYETRGEAFQMALDDNLEPVELLDANGDRRQLPEFPSGGGELEGESRYAKTLEDYRHLYKSFLLDADLQAARARYPFICIWDDHEMSDDCWQSQANYNDEDSLDEPSQTRRLAASQAWFEYIPAILTESEDADVDPQARDFEAADVSDEAFDSAGDEPNNRAAIESLTIYRNLRFGKHVDLVLTDNRSYRSDHAIPEEIAALNQLSFHPRAGLSKEAVVVFDAGRNANDGAPPDAVGPYTNTRKESEPGTMLGAQQKAWLKDVLEASTASFRVWGNSVPLLRILLDSTHVALIADDLVLSADSWDGYPSERNELMKFLRDGGIRNVVSLSGDHHAHFAGLVHDDHEAAEQTPVMVDIASAGISSASQWTLVAGQIVAAAGPDLQDVIAPIKRVIVYDATELGGDEKAVVNLNALIRYGSAAANAAADTHDLDEVEAARDPAINSHLRFASTAAQGYGIARFAGDEAQVTLVTVEPPLSDLGEDGAEIRGTASFVIPHVGEGDVLDIEEPTLTGTKPFPLR